MRSNTRCSAFVLVTSTWFIAIVFLLVIPCIAAQDKPCSASFPASDVRLELTLKSDHAVFDQGEIIPVSLSFTTKTQDSYWLHKERYNNIGRSMFEQYCVVPEASDPLESFLRAHGVYGSELQPQALGPKPIVIQSELNRFLNLSPGYYRLFAISHRVMPAPEQTGPSQLTYHSETVRSNSMEFEVKPASSEGQAAQLEALVHILMEESSPEEMDRAAHRLRFLNSRDSTVALARLFPGAERDPVPSDLFLGLYGSPYRQLVVDALHAEITTPGHAISENFLDTLVDLQIGADPAWTPPAFSDSPEAERESEIYHQRRKAHELELRKAESRKLLAALPLKAGPARALSALGVLTTEADDIEFVRTARPTLLASWDDLPLKSQQELVSERWSLVDVPEMLPILLRMAHASAPTDGTYAATVRDAVLSHIRELDPSAASGIVLAELQASHGEPTVELLKLLQPQDLAAALQPSIERIVRGPSTNDPFEQRSDFVRLWKFGDLGVLPQMKHVFEQRGGNIECSQLNSILRYFLRVAPEYGAAQVAALHEGKAGKVDCRGSIFFSLEEMLPAVEQVAIHALDNPKAMIVADAAQSLGNWGSAAAEAPLWARMERYHRQWTGSKDQARRSPTRIPEGFDATVETNLITALAGGANWFCSPQKLAHLKELAVTDSERERIQQWIDAWKSGPPIVTPNWWGEDAVEFSMLASSGFTEEQIRTKLAHFPSGTRLLWQIWQPGYISSTITMKRQEAEYEAMRAVAEKNGVTLVKSVSP